VNLELERLDSAASLPETWDGLATSGFQSREFLAHTDRENPCHQRYYLGFANGRLVAGACIYTLRLDLLTFLKVKSPIRMHFLGVPCSVSAAGLLGAPKHTARLVDQLRQEERGLLVGLNLDHAPDLPGLVSGHTLPTVVIDRHFSSWRAYRAALRSSYRRRIDRQARAWAGVVSERGPCTRFDDVAYLQYRDVLSRSAAKLECLSADFFRRLPGWFNLTLHRRDDRLLGWHVTATQGTHRSFFIGGIDYSTNAAEHHYFNVLASVVREAIEDGAHTVDLGQTAEIPKTRLGGRIVQKAMFGWHSNRVGRFLLARGRRLLEYRVQVPEARVFHHEDRPGHGAAVQRTEASAGKP